MSGREMEDQKAAVSRDAEFNWITSQVAAHRAMPLPTFALFIQTFAAIVGGSIWLSYEKGLSQAARDRFSLLTDAAVVILAGTFGVLVWHSWRGWLSYRRTHSKMLGLDPPQVYPPVTSWLAIIIAMAAASIAFCILNPFLK
jgi:hypothetical protein